MSEQVLLNILDEIRSLKEKTDLMDSKFELMNSKFDLMDSKLTETNQIVRAIRDRQDETDAKLEALTMDVHKLYGKVSALKDEIEFTYQKTSRNELEIL